MVLQSRWGAGARGMSEGADRRVLQLGGLSGILVGVLIVVGLILTLTVPAAVLTSQQSFFQSSDATKATILTVGRIGYVAPLLYLPFAVVFYQSLRKTRSVSALVGVILGVMGSAAFTIYFHGLLGVLFSLSDRYVNATPSDQTAILIAGLAAGAILNGLEVAGIHFLGLSFIALGVSALGNATFHKALGWLAVALGVATVAVALPFVPVSVLFSFPLWAVFSLIFGGKIYSLSRGVSASSS